MYNSRDIFKKLEGRDFTGPELEKELNTILIAYISDIPIEIEAEDLFRIACRKGWVKETDDGKLQFHVDDRMFRRASLMEVNDAIGCKGGYTTAPDGYAGEPCPFWTMFSGDRKKK